MQSPLIPLFIITFYLYFVQRLGPRLMENRPPLKIENVMIVYNVVQILMASYIVKEVRICDTQCFEKSNYKN